MTKHSKRFFGVCCALWCASCDSVTPRTQVMLTVDADGVARGLVTKLEVSITGTAAMGDSDGASSFDSVQEPVDGMGWPYEYALVPRDGDSGRTYRIVATASQGEKKIAVLRTESGFIKEKTLRLLMMFDAGCLHEASLKCADNQTCVEKNCVPARLDADDLPDLPEPDRDAGPGIITGVPPTGTTGSPVTGTSGAGGAAGSRTAGSGGGGGAAGDPADPGPVGSGVCGDGAVNIGEACDTAIPAGQAGACPTTCVPSMACETSVLEGTACQARCRTTPITATAPGDGCCPRGVDANNDSDCAATCGNGIVESGETCDPTSSCPTPESCQAADACLRPMISGNANSCNFACQMEPIVVCQSGDGCCPETCSRADDGDCSASCGDGVVDPGTETCEPGSPTAPCPASCDDGNTCTLDFQNGSARNCNTVCVNQPIVLPLNFDGCCAPGANANTDNDCDPVCGNRVTESGERCDSNCPSSDANCDDDNVCTRDTVSGSGCRRQCNHAAITANRNQRDQCCPAGANATTDADCQAMCGNGVVESPERCDGNCPTSCTSTNVCMTAELMGSSAMCTAECRLTPTEPNTTTEDECCPTGANANTDIDCQAMCGNDVTEEGETCDASCPTDQTCRASDPCSRVTGAGCNTMCMADAAQPNVTTRDQCCPDDANPRTDIDCEPMCGNEVVEGDEECDDGRSGSATCDTSCRTIDPPPDGGADP